MQFELFLSRRRKRAHPIQDATPRSQEIMTLFKTLNRKIIYLFKTEDTENHTIPYSIKEINRKNPNLTGIFCYICHQSYHLSCVNRSNNENSHSGQTDDLWYCAKCLSLPFNHLNTNESYNTGL